MSSVSAMYRYLSLSQQPVNLSSKFTPASPSPTIHALKIPCSPCHVSCSFTSSLPVPIILFSSCCSTVPHALCRQHWYHVLLDAPNGRVGRKRIKGGLGLHMVNRQCIWSPGLIELYNVCSHLLVTRPSKSRSLECFVVSMSERSTHLAMFVRVFA